MNLGGVAQYHIGKLRINAGYTQTITLNTTLYVDVLEMDGGTITSGNGVSLAVYQRTDSQAIGAATIFATSTWSRGTISTGGLYLMGEDAHRVTFQLGAANRTLSLQAPIFQINQTSTVNWQAGTINVANGVTITNLGTFLADGNTTFGGNLQGNDRASLVNRGRLNQGRGTFSQRLPVTNQAPGRTFRVQAQGEGPNTFHIAGTYTQDEADTLTQIEDGTLLVGLFSQTAGDLNVQADTLLTVSTDFTESADANFNIELTTPTSGSGLVTVNGVVTINGATLTVTALAGFDGDEFTLIQNNGEAAVIGIFAGLPEGAVIFVDGTEYVISYEGGSGNDVILTSTSSTGMLSGSVETFNTPSNHNQCLSGTDIQIHLMTF